MAELKSVFNNRQQHTYYLKAACFNICRDSASHILSLIIGHTPHFNSLPLSLSVSHTHTHSDMQTGGGYDNSMLRVVPSSGTSVSGHTELMCCGTNDKAEKRIVLAP